MRCLLTTLAALLLLAEPLAAEEPSTPPAAIRRLLVLELSSTGVDVNVAKSLTEVLSQSLRQALPDTAVLGQSEINSMLALEKQRDLLGCANDVACLAYFGGALGADHLVVGSVGKIGTLYLINIKLLNSTNASTVRHVSAEVSAREELLVEATRQWAVHLVNPNQAAGLGVLNIQGSGEVLVDDVKVGNAPIPHLLTTPGTHRVTWRDGDPVAVTAEREVSVDSYDTARVLPGRTLQPKANPTPAPTAAPSDSDPTAPRWLFFISAQYAFPGMNTKGHHYGVYCQSSASCASQGSDTMALSSGYGIDITALYQFAEHHALSLAVTYAKVKIKSDLSDLDAEPVLSGAAYSTMFGYQFVAPKLGPVTPYIGVLLGMLSVGVSETDYLTVSNYKVDNYTDRDFSVTPELGVRVALVGRLVLNVGARFGMIMPLVAGTGLMYAPVSVGLGGEY